MGEAEFSCGGLGSSPRTARTDHGSGLGRVDVCGIALTCCRTVVCKTLEVSVDCTCLPVSVDLSSVGGVLGSIGSGIAKFFGAR